MATMTSSTRPFLAAQTEPAGTGLSPEELLKQAFPGAEEV